MADVPSSVGRGARRSRNWLTCARRLIRRCASYGRLDVSGYLTDDGMSICMSICAMKDACSGQDIGAKVRAWSCYKPLYVFKRAERAGS
jgi:hypothetical protein